VADFLLELLTEEIPARMQPAAAVQLKERFAALLANAGLSAEALEADATPRRLALLAHGLPEASAPVTEERRGPRADAPEAAIAGFLKSAGLTRDQLEERETGKGRFLFATIRQDGQPTAALLAQHLPGLLRDMAWPKSMRWEDSGFRWVRPLRSIVALLDGNVVPFEVAGLTSGRMTYGHRTMGGREPFEIVSAATYKDQLRATFVILSAEERAAIIREKAAAAAAAAGLTLVADEALVAENAGLTEWPVPLLGRFDPAFLTVPPELLTLTMKVNQKYFACLDGDGKLAPAFVCVANLEAPDGGQAIVAGNERVLAARLSDARFFWEQDLKVPLEDQAAKLSGIVFHEKLGTMAEKVERVAKLARWLVETYPAQFPGATPDLVERAARLAKADLVTGTVGEFPELQGIIGGHIAKAQGEPKEIVEALRQHYAPVPDGPVPVAVALADRLDTFVCFFGAGLIPTGSRDPFALRRTALGIVDLLVERSPSLGLESLLREAVHGSSNLQANSQATFTQLQDFLFDRLAFRLREMGISPDIVAAVRKRAVDNLARAAATALAVKKFLETDDGNNLLAGFKRAANILRIEDARDGPHSHSVDPYLIQKEAENHLALALEHTAEDVRDSVSVENFAKALQALASIRPLVDRFFDEVTVNADTPELRRNRLAILYKLTTTADFVADFSRIEG
jgi:glycyl-tRNA synthetase beta chain